MWKNFHKRQRELQSSVEKFPQSIEKTVLENNPEQSFFVEKQSETGKEWGFKHLFTTCKEVVKEIGMPLAHINDEKEVRKYDKNKFLSGNFRSAGN